MAGAASRLTAQLTAGARLSIGLLTVLPVRVADVDRSTAGTAMLAAPLAGLAVGGAAALVAAVARQLGSSDLVSAVLAVAVMAVMTRMLHLDGLADLADGLGSGRPADGALTVMRQSDIGPFGVVTLVLALALQVAAVAASPHPAAAVLIAAVAGRLTLVWACRAGVPAARPTGLGALVAGTVATRPAACCTAGAVAVCAAAAWAVGGAGLAAAAVAAVALGLLAALLLLRHAVRRLGGITGDVLGALVETAVTVTLLVLSTR